MTSETEVCASGVKPDGDVQEKQEETDDNTSTDKCEPSAELKDVKECCSTYLDSLFPDRYTLENTNYATISKGFDPVVMIHPYNARPKRVFDHSRGGGGWRGRGDRGNWRGGGDRGNWRGGNGGGNWRGGGGDRGNWRGGGGWQGKRRHDDNGGDGQWRGGGGRGRVHYPGQY